MSKLRSLNTAFWSDTWVEELEPMQKLLFIYLVTNEKTNMLGIYEASVKKISFETGIVPIVVKTYLKDFEKSNKVKYIDNRVILINYMKHQNYNTNMKKSAIDTYNDLPKSLKVNGLFVSKSNPTEGFERLSKGYGMVPKVEVEVEVKIESEKEYEVEELTADNIFLSIRENYKVYANQLFSDTVFTDSVAKDFMKNKSKQITLPTIKKYLGLYLNRLDQDKKIHNNKKEFMSHFPNWLRKQNIEYVAIKQKEQRYV